MSNNLVDAKTFRKLLSAKESHSCTVQKGLTEYSTRTTSHVAVQNNSKNNCQNFREIIFLKIYFYIENEKKIGNIC
jgi:hypothetical protein